MLSLTCSDLYLELQFHRNDKYAAFNIVKVRYVIVSENIRVHRSELPSACSLQQQALFPELPQSYSHTEFVYCTCYKRTIRLFHIRD